MKEKNHGQILWSIGFSLEGYSEEHSKNIAAFITSVFLFLLYITKHTYSNCKCFSYRGRLYNEVIRGAGRKHFFSLYFKFYFCIANTLNHEMDLALIYL